MLPFRPLIAKGIVPISGTPAQLNRRTPKQDHHRHHHTDDDWEDWKQTVFQLYIGEDRTAEDVVETLRRDFDFKASRRKLFEKFEEWGFKKNRKRHRGQKEDTGIRPGDKRMLGDTTIRIAKRQHILTVTALAPSGTPASGISCLDLEQDHDTTTSGKSPSQASHGKSFLLSSTDFACTRTSPTTKYLEANNANSSVPPGTLSARPPSISEFASGLAQTTYFPVGSQFLETSTAVGVRKLSSTPSAVHIDNIPWFKFLELVHTFMKQPRINCRDHVYDCDSSMDHQTDCSKLDSHVSVMEGILLWSSMPEEGAAVTYLLDVLGEQCGSNLHVVYKQKFSPIIDDLFSRWTSCSPILNIEEHIQALHSYFMPFILERQDGELVEGVYKILGPLPDGLLQFLCYTINLLSNNLLLYSEIAKLVRWIDEIRGYKFLTKLLSLKVPTIQAFASNILPCALRLKNDSLVYAILDAGINPNSPMGYTGIRPLQYVAQFGTIGLVQLLLKFGADVNAPPTAADRAAVSLTALQAASKRGNIDIVRLLLEAGADVNAPPVEWDGGDFILRVHTPTGEYGGLTALQAAAWNGNIELVQVLLKAGAHINALPAKIKGFTALQAAAWNGNIELIQVLLEAGANANGLPADWGYTALQIGAMKGNIEVVQLLLEAGADVNASPGKRVGVFYILGVDLHTREYDEFTALQAASKNGNIDIVQVLLKAGADINAPPKNAGLTAVQAAAWNGNIELVQFLLEAGADINARPGENSGLTAIQAAAWNGNIELVQFLLEAGADINALPIEENGYTAIQAAAWNGSIELVQVLLKAGADINALPAKIKGFTILQAAAWNGNIELIRTLLEAGADINAPPADWGYTALEIAAYKENIELVQVLLEAEADINAPPGENSGLTALQAAAWSGNIELVRVLLEAGADVNAPPGENGGLTAIQAASWNGNIELLQILLEAGAEINALPTKVCGFTALQAAIQNGNIELVQVLLEAGADINGPPGESGGRSALQFAAETGNVEVVQVLLNGGAFVDAPPSRVRGVTALQAAAIRGHIRVAQLLLNAGANVNAAPAVEDGRTALGGAAEHGRIDMLQLLINAGADINSIQFTAALELAAKNGHDVACELLHRFKREVG